MPNWVTNSIFLEGTDADVQEIVKFVRSPESEFDFNNILPMPAALKGICSPETAECKKLVEKYRKLKKHTPKTAYKFLQKHFPVEELLGDLTPARKNTLQGLKAFIETGYTDRYSWCNKNWGTKWNVSNLHFNDHATFTFDTAWSTPYPVIQKLSEQFPNVLFKVEYADEDIGSNCGEYSFRGGAEESVTAWEGDAAVMRACELKGYDYDDYMVERNQDSA